MQGRHCTCVMCTLHYSFGVLGISVSIFDPDKNWVQVDTIVSLGIPGRALMKRVYGSVFDKETLPRLSAFEACALSAKVLHVRTSEHFYIVVAFC